MVIADSLDPNEVNTDIDNLENTKEGAKVADGFNKKTVIL